MNFILATLAGLALSQTSCLNKECELGWTLNEATCKCEPHLIMTDLNHEPICGGRRCDLPGWNLNPLTCQCQPEQACKE